MKPTRNNSPEGPRHVPVPADLEDFRKGADAEAFEFWCLHPVTRIVARAFATLAEEQRKNWENLSWHGGKANPERLIEMRTRSAAFEYFAALTKEELDNIAKR